MRKLILLIMLVYGSLHFSIIFQIGREIIYTSESVFLNFDDTRKIVDAVSFFLEYQPPKFVENKDYQAIIFNDRILGYDGKDYILHDGNVIKDSLSVKELLDYFYIPYVSVKNKIIVPSAFVESIESAGVLITVYYLGIPKLYYGVKNGIFEVFSTGYTFYNGEIYNPGEVLYQIRVGNFEVGEVVEEQGKDIVKLIKKGEEKKVVIIPYNPNNFSLIKPLPYESIGIVVGKGKGIVIVRPTTPDLQGLDREFFKLAKNTGQKLAKALRYNFEICPIKGIPPASSYILVVLENPDDYRKLPGLLRRLSGIEKIVDFTVSYDQLFDFGN
ncbi:MAG: DUF4941 domain-containing protein [Thermotogaceae bacterium]|nr:DUF4941 domain-containing protein [Thermotogaceae bacterium]